MIHAQISDTAPNASRRSRAWRRTIVLSMILLSAGAMPRPLLAAPSAAMNLTVVNQSGYSDDQVYFIMICQSPIGYLDFRNHILVETPSFTLDATTMTATLAQIKAYSGDGSATIPCPAMGSSRIYFAFGKNFDQMGGFAVSGPEKSSANPVPWSMFEVNLSGGKFVNQSDVDFFSIAYTLGVINGSGEPITVGIATPSKTIFDQFEAIPSPANSAQQSGNTDIFKALIIKNSAGEVVRVLSPKSAALSDLGANDALPQMCTHFLDDYVNNHCWKPGRTFSFSSKLNSDPATYYGKVSADGLTLALYTDAALTTPYTIPSLPRPSNSWGNPDFRTRPDLWHNVGITSTVPADIDWGYLLYGQDGYPSGPGAYWITDPVVMTIPVSIARGVMHLDNGTVDWKDSTKYYQGTNGASTSESPIFYYGQILHQFGLAGKVYALSFDDVYGTDSGVGFTDPAVALTLYPFNEVTTVGPSIQANGVANNITVNYPNAVSVAVAMNAGDYVGTPVDWWVVACAGSSWYYLDSATGWMEQSNWLNWRPAHQGALCDLSTYEVLNITGLSAGSYTFYFAVDVPMDGVLNNVAGQILVDTVNVTVQ